MRFQEYLIEKITRKEFDSVLDKDEVNCGCEFEFYFEAAGPKEHPDKDRMINKATHAEDEARDAEQAIKDYQNELEGASQEFDKRKEDREELDDKLSHLEDQESELEDKISDLEDKTGKIGVAGEKAELKMQRKETSIKKEKLEDEIKDIDNDLDELDKFIDEGAWEKYADDMPSASSMPSYDDVLTFFEDEFGMEVYMDRATGRRYDSFNELSLSWIERQEVPNLQQDHLGFTIEDFFDNLESERREFSEEDLMKEDFPLDLYKNGWRVEEDGSLGPNGVEVITPTVKINELIDIIDEVFDWIEQVGHTDSTCGFHVHMSLDASIYELDPLKLIMFVEEGKIYEHFRDRLGNRYAESIAKGHLSNIAPFTVEELKKVAKKEKIEKNLNTEKFLGLHLIELEENHVEFRYMGAEDYHNKFKAVRNNIVNYAYWLSIACDPDFKKKEYLKKLQKMVDQYNKVLIYVSTVEFKTIAKSNFKMHNKMTGITKSKYDKLLDKFIQSYNKEVKNIPQPPDKIFYNIFNSIEVLIDKKIQQLKKEFTEKVKKVA